MRVLGLDLGTRRIGLAVSDAAGRIAFPEGYLERRGLRRDLAALRQLARDRGISRVVVGLPVHMNGREGPEAGRARSFAAALTRFAELPVELLDERWTTREADRVLGSYPPGPAAQRRAPAPRKTRGGSNPPGRRDAVAASLLLSTFLARQAQRRDAEDHPE